MADSNNVRFGISALDLDYAAMAEKDELLVRGTDGQMLYKRAGDGIIVTPTSLVYNKELLTHALQRKFANALKTETPYTEHGFYVNKNNFMVCNTISIAGLNSLESKNTVSFGITKRYNISLDTPVFFIRARATDVVAAAVSYIEKKSMILDAGGPTCLFRFNVRETTQDGGVISSTLSVTAKFDDLTLVRLTPSSSSLRAITVTPLTVQFPYFKDALASVSEELLAEIRSLNYENVNLEADCVDFITVTNDISSPTIYDKTTNTKLDYMMTMGEVVEGIDLEYASVEMSLVEPFGDLLWIRLTGTEPPTPPEPDETPDSDGDPTDDVESGT